MNTYITKIVRVGTSLGVVIPKEFLTAYKLQRGDQVVFVCVDDDIVGIAKLQEVKIKTIN